MAKEISYQEALGESTGIRESESTRKSPKLISYDEAIGKKVPDAIDRGAREQTSFTGQAKAVAKDVAGYAAGVGGQLVDMFAAIPRAAAIPATLGVQLYAGAKGEGSKIAGEAGLLYQEQFLPEWTQNAYKKIAKALGPEAEAYYERNGIAQFLQAFGEGVDKGADKLEEATGYPAAFLKTAVNQGMDILGVKLTKGDLKRSVSIREAATQKKLMDVQRRPAGPAQFTPEEMTLRERADAARKAAAEAAASRSKWDEKQASEAAAVRKQEEWASRMEEPPVLDERFPPSGERGRFAPAEAEGVTPPPGSTRLERVGEVPGEGKALDETTATIESALEKVRNGQNFDLTAAEKIALRGIEQAEAGKPVPKIKLPERFKNQKGEIDKKLLAGMAAAGLGAIAGQWLDDDDPLKGALIGGLSGAALVSMMRGDVPSRFYQSGAVKGKGGMWHPEAAERLSEPLKAAITGIRGFGRDVFPARDAEGVYSPEQQRQLATADWSDRAIKNYLNKHAGTPTDPLKDVEVPFGEGTKRWEELTDKAIKAYPASDYHAQKAMFGDTDIPALEKIPGNESIWNVDGLASTQNALKNYLSHVGDYLRENVAPEKLQQYDLVRAVQETAKWDEALAKKMAKERADLTKDMPLVKDYGDGFKWVEVKAKPLDKLPDGWKVVQTSNIHNGVRMADVYRVVPPDGGSVGPGEGKAGWFSKAEAEAAALDLARRAKTEKLLKDEGDQMGHCFPAGTLVTAPQPQAIERLRVGDEVITHTGAVKKVTELFKRAYEGELVTITPRGNLAFECTPEHPVLIVRPVTTGSRWKDRYIDNRLPSTLLPRWIEAKDLQEGDYLLSPGLQQTAKYNPELNDFSWMLGLYAGDGDPNAGAGIQFTLSPNDDLERLRSVIETLGYRPRFSDKEQFYRVRVNSRELSERFRAWFSDTSQTKHLPSFLFDGATNLKAVLQGLTDADGTYYEGRYRFTSTSIALAQQVWFIAVTLGYRPSIIQLKRTSGFANASPAWVVEWQELEGKWHSNIRWNSFYATPVIKLQKRLYKGLVYNIEVEDDHSYLVNGLAVHNCVGGYCDYVESGESKIYSLRDEKGKSHVTIEVTPADIRKNSNSPNAFLKEYPEMREKYGHSGGQYESEFNNEWMAGNRRVIASPEFQAWLRAKPEDIVQIKGKQNRAPNKEYLPYVQDFVKSGKWGEVGDLENARLVKTQAGNFVTMEEAVKGLRGERGSADPQVIRALAGAGLGALAGAYAAPETDRGSAIGGAILGALGGVGLMTIGGRAILKKSLENADVALGMLSTRLKNESPAIYRRMQQMAMNGIKDTYVAINGAEPLFVGIDKLKEAGKPIEDALIRNDWNAARLEIAKNGTPGMMEALDRAKATIDFLGRRALEKGRIKKLNPDHFPRIVKDYEGLQAVLNPEAKSGLEGKLYEAERAMKNKEARLLTPAERTQIVEQYLRSNPRGSFLPDYAKARKITDVTDALLPFYEKPVKAFHQRMREMVEDYQRDELFGKDAVYKTEDGKRFLDLDKSIATLVDREMTAGRLTNEGAAQVRDMLQAYLKGGSQQMNWILQDAKNAITGLLLGNHIAALTQYADAVPIAAVQGFKPTLAAFVEMMQGKSVLKPADFGLINHISEEFISNRPSQRFVNWSLSNSYIPDIVGGKVFDKFLSFSGADMNMKQLSINAALKAGQRAAAEGSPDLARKWEAALGEDFPKLVEDLRAKVDSPLVREYVWHELTQQQPVSKLEMPQWALENPNGRILMSMKSWMLKQADLMRRKVYDQYKSGDKKGALGNALSLMTAYGVGGAAVGQVTNWLLGRDTEPGIGDIFENAFKTFALNQFTRENIAQGKVEDALVSTVMPPVRVFGDIWRGLWMIDDPKHANKLMRYFIPGWGPMAYAHLGGGAERFNERLAKEKAREAREALMTDEQREARDAKRKMTPAERRELRNEGRLKPMVLENYSNTIFTDTPGELRGVSNRQEFAGSRISEELKKKGRAERQAGEREFLKKRMDRVFLKAWKRNSEGTIDTARNLRAQADEAQRKAKRKLYI